MTAHRQFQRIKFVAKTEVVICGVCHDASLMDISLKGAQLAFQDEIRPEAGLPCKLSIHLNLSDLVLKFEGVTVHSHDNLTGIKFTTIHIETMIHLRRLIELNSADPEQVRSEICSFGDS